MSLCDPSQNPYSHHGNPHLDTAHRQSGEEPEQQKWQRMTDGTEQQMP